LSRSSAFAVRFPEIVEALGSLPVRSCFIDGEAIVVDANGLSVVNLLRYRQRDHAAVLCAFDLIEVDGEDLRLTPLQDRKRTLADLLGRKHQGIALNTHYEGDGAIIFKHACLASSSWLTCVGFRSNSGCHRAHHSYIRQTP
jgi:bifunctional non-homologous end joining protein LigD